MSRNFGNYTDIELWKAFKNGDEDAFDYIFEKHVHLLYNYGRKFTAIPEIIEDCVQDLFVEIWEKKKILSNTDSIKFYLFKSLRLKIIRRLAKENKLARKDLNTENYDFTISLPYETRLITCQQDIEQRMLLTQAVNSLSKRQKEVVHLKYYDNLSYAQIAGIMDISVDSVYKLISGALATLKKHVRYVCFSILWCTTIAYYLLFFCV